MEPLLVNPHLIKVMPHLFESLLEYNSSSNMIYFHCHKPNTSIEKKWYNYDEIFQIYLKKYIYPADQNLIISFFSKEGIKNFLNSGKESSSIHIRYIKNNTDFEWHEIFINKLDNDNLIFSNRNIHSEQKYKVLSRAVEKQFDYVVHIDIKNNSYVLYPSLVSNKAYLPPIIGENYHKVLEEYNYKAVDYESFTLDKLNSLIENMRIPNVVKRLETTDEYNIYVTTIENNEKRYKKLSFRYLNEKKEKLLLSRIDISEFINEKKISQLLLKNKAKYQERLTKYLDDMPIAYCTIKVLVDENNNPYDFVFVYCNKAHSELEGVEHGELIGKPFYKFFENADKKWLKYYYDTAFNGIAHTISEYSPEIGKHLLIYTHQPEKSVCGCILQDISSKRKLEIELDKTRERLKLLLKSATEAIFYYDPETKTLSPFIEDDIKYDSSVIEIENIPFGLIERDFVDKAYLEDFQKALLELENGKAEISFDFKGRLYTGEPLKWLNFTFFNYKELYTDQKKVLCFLRDVDLIKQREESLRTEAQRDPLTKLLNIKAGKNSVKNYIFSQKDSSFNAMLIIDIDNFKTINDTLGHQKGDEVLKNFAEAFNEIFRNTDIIYRLGGDEFIIFIKRLKNPETVLNKIMDRFFIFLKEKETNQQVKLECSIGIFATNKKHSYEDYYAQADKALYEIKRKTKNNYHIIIDK